MESIFDIARRFIGANASDAMMKKYLDSQGNDRRCRAGYTWVMAEETELYRIDRCEGYGHIRIVMKNPPLKKQKKVELVKSLDGQLVKGEKTVEDNILE